MILKYYHTTFLFTAIFLLFQCIINAQPLEVTDGDTPPFEPENILENYFFGGGVEILNITFNGAPNAVGFFDGTTSNIGIDRGIILTSGDADNAEGPNIDDAVEGVNFLQDEEDLELLIPGFDILDPVVYEIQFIPFDTIVRFNYVFGSDEYPEYAPPSNSAYNDVFGFFISGPGINGPFTDNAENIAYLPDGVTPVSINNVNAITNNQYYIDNDNGATVEYDGFTVPLEASAIVIPCDTYNIKIALADAGDAQLDSGVFLASGSFGTDALNISVNTFSPDSTMVEGCVPAAVEFTLAIPTEVDLPIDYNIWGTAQNGVDYDPVPTSAIIPAGQDSLTLLFNPIEDGIAEGLEVIYLEVQTNICGKDTFAIYIDDNQLVPPALSDETICEGESISVDATLPITLPESTTFTNNQSVDITDNQPTNPVFSTIDIFGAIPEQIVEGSILSVCIDITHTYVGDLDIYLISPNGQFLNLSTDNGGSGDNFEQACFTLDASTLIQGLVSADTPFTGDYLPESPWEDIYGADMNGVWTLQISDDSPGFTGTLNSWSITIPPIYGIGYTWEPTEGVSDPNAPDVDLSPTQTTTYYITATDTYGCSTMDSMTVNVSPGLPAPVVTCDDSVNGQLTFSWDAIQGATAYEINVNGTGWVIPSDNLSHFIAGLSDGQVVTVEVRGISIGTCASLTAILSCTATNPGCALLPNIDTTQDVTCNGDTNGSATVSVTGGTAPYTYTLNGMSQSNGTFTNLAAGNYTLSIEDNLGCATTQTIMIDEPDILELTATHTNTSCGGIFITNDGTIMLTASGGTPDYMYSLDNVNFTNNNIFENLGEGDYTLYVNDVNNCEASVEVTVSSPPGLGLNYELDGFFCNGDEGTITITAGGGTPDYMYSVGYGYQVSNIFENVPFTVGGVFVMDANGCEFHTDISIIEPTPITLTTSNTPASCNGGTDGSATVEATNGEAPYNYQWDSNANNQTTQTATDLALGSYNVTVTDNNGCTATTVASVPELSSLEYTIEGSELDCNGDTNGTASVTVTAGTMPYNYEWSNGQITESISGLSCGIYTITITDGGGCSAVNNIEVIEPEALTLDLTSTNALCNGDTGTITGTTNGGTTPYLYEWSNAETTANINATADTYICTVTDANGCTATAEASITEPAPLILNYTNTNIDCNGTGDGTITLTASGGTPNYMYSLDNVNFQNNNIFNNLNGGNYIVYVNDANDCTAMQEVTITESSTITLMLTSTAESCDGNDGTATVTAANGAGDYTYLWTGGQSTAIASMLNAGTYTVTVTDANDCTAIDSIEVASSANIQLGATATDVTCFGAADGEGIVIADGVPPYTYLWDANAGNQTGASATGLSGGTYTVEVTDGTGCTAATNVIINEPDQLILDITGVNLSCSGEANGGASVTASGGTGTYLYEWNNMESTPQINDLFAGDYSVTVTDTNGCQETATVTLTQPAESISINAVGSTVDCYGDSNGTITVNAAGGTPPYIYSLDNENFTTSNMFSGLSADTYTVYAQDATGDCLANTTATVTEPAELLVNAGEDIELIYGDSITLTATPNLPGDYSYSWFSFAPDWNLSCTDCPEPLAKPSYQTGYTVTIANENGCEATDDINIYIKKEQLIFVANAFTPNGDSFNDFLYVQGSVAAEEVTVFQVYDRWGELVFDNRNIALNDKEAGWDGTLNGQEMNPAVFVWYAEVRFVDGSVLPYTGNSTLIR